MSEYQTGDRVCFTDYAWLQYDINLIVEGSHKAMVLSLPSATTIQVKRDGLRNPITYHRKYWKLNNDLDN